MMMSELEKIIVHEAKNQVGILSNFDNLEYRERSVDFAEAKSMTRNEYMEQERNHALITLHAYVLLGAAGTRIMSTEAKDALKAIQNEAVEVCSSQGVTLDTDNGEIE